MINGTGVEDEASYKHMNDGATFPSVKITNRNGTTVGKIELGSGAAAPDVELYREQANVLKTRDQFVTTKAITIMTKAGLRPIQMSTCPRRHHGHRHHHSQDLRPQRWYLEIRTAHLSGL
jgi:hypothetical protein